jgi:hypothetical protein
MDAKRLRIVTGLAVAGAGVLASRSLRIKLHKHCEGGCSPARASDEATLGDASEAGAVCDAA